MSSPQQPGEVRSVGKARVSPQFMAWVMSLPITGQIRDMKHRLEREIGARILIEFSENERHLAGFDRLDPPSASMKVTVIRKADGAILGSSYVPIEAITYIEIVAHEEHTPTRNRGPTVEMSPARASYGPTGRLSHVPTKEVPTDIEVPAAVKDNTLRQQSSASRSWLTKRRTSCPSPRSKRRTLWPLRVLTPPRSG